MWDSESRIPESRFRKAELSLKQSFNHTLQKQVGAHKLQLLCLSLLDHQSNGGVQLGRARDVHFSGLLQV